MATRTARARRSAPPVGGFPRRNPASSRKNGKVRIELRVKGFKPQPDPYGAETNTFRMRIAASSLSHELLEWMAVNPREQKLQGPIIRGMAETWEEFPEEFFRINRGILLFGRQLEYDSTTQTVTLTFQNRKMDGVGDGGHTLRLILERLIPETIAGEEPDDIEESDEDEEIGGPPVERYVEAEVITGLSLEEISRVARSRNTSKNVPDYAIKRLEGTFDGLEQALRRANETFTDHCVAFKPNEHIEDSKDFKQVSILTILQILCCMDIDHYDVDQHPIEAYKNKGKTPEFFVQREDTYRKMYPIVDDILRLFDTIRARLPEAYNRTRLRWGSVIKEPVGIGMKEELLYIDPSGETLAPKAPQALFFPIFSAFRAALYEANGKYAWVGGVRPTDWPEDEFDDLLVKLGKKIRTAVNKRGDNFNAVGRDNEVWDVCYSVVDKHLYVYERQTRKTKRQRVS